MRHCRRFSALVLQRLVLLPLALLAAQTAPAADVSAPSGQPLSIERIFAAPELSGQAQRNPGFSPDGRFVTYLKGAADNKDRLDLWAYDLTRREHRKLVDARSLVPQERRLSAEEEQRRERQRISSLAGIVDFEFSADSRYLLVPLSGDLYLYDLRAPTSSAVRQLTKTDAFETDAKFSPRGRYVSFVRDQNLFAIELATGREIAITKEGAGLVSFGVAEFIAQEEMNRTTGYWWSPDEARIAYARVEETPVDEVERFEINADNVTVVRQRYPAAGRPNARVDLFIHDIADGAVRPVTARDEYLARVAWFPDGGALALQTQSRDQKTLVLWRVDAATGRASALITERSDSWVPLHDELTFLPRTRQFIWASVRSGFKHLYLYDEDGRARGALTGGEWMVVGDDERRAIRGVDETRELVYFMANRDTPIERHLYVASLRPAADGSPPTAPRRLTTMPGWHAVSMSGDTRSWLDTFSDPDTPPSLTLRRIDGSPIATLVPNRLDAAHPYAPYLDAHLRTEFGTLPAADGQTLYWQMLRPRNLVPGRKYPVIVDLYGGPGYQRVRRAWMGGGRSNEGFFRQILAQSGYIVFTLDNRGSGQRGTSFETALYRRMGTVEVEDQVRGVEYLRTLAYVDAARVGVSGWSYGGYMALMCVLRAPQYFSAAVSGAPVTDWALYDTHYTERYMGTPQDNAAGYADSSTLTHAAALQSPLLLMHGMADDNVLFTNSTAMIKRLQDANRPFDVMVYPGSKHGLLRFAATGPHAYAEIKRFFDQTLGSSMQYTGATAP